MIWTIVIIVVLIVMFFSGIKVIDQYEKAIVFTLGEFTGIREPGYGFDGKAENRGRDK
jgi:regulator of protease activity HflC (stomatin/prohibitin superfamily)